MQPVKVPGDLCISCETGQGLLSYLTRLQRYGQLQSWFWPTWQLPLCPKSSTGSLLTHDAPTASEVGVSTFLLWRESVLIPTTPPVTKLLTVPCPGVKVPGRDERSAVSFNLWKLATFHCSYSRSRSRARRVGQSNPHNQSNEGDQKKNSGNDESSIFAIFHCSRQINCWDSESNFPGYIARINISSVDTGDKELRDCRLLFVLFASVGWIKVKIKVLL